MGRGLKLAHKRSGAVVMGKVIALPLSRKITTGQPDGGSAEILFFTGVRYYRMSDEDVAKHAVPAPKRRAAKVATTPTRKLRKLA